MITTAVQFKPITPRVRAGKRGKHIMCPNCRTIRKVYHFNWSGLTCPDCKEAIDKELWSVEVK